MKKRKSLSYQERSDYNFNHFSQRLLERYNLTITRKEFDDLLNARILYQFFPEKSGPKDTISFVRIVEWPKAKERCLPIVIDKDLSGKFYVKTVLPMNDIFRKKIA